MGKSRVKGAAAYRRLLRQLPQSANDRFLALLNTAGPALAADMKTRIHSRTGRLVAGIGAKVTPKALNLKVGILNKKLGRSDLFYGHILDVGRKAQTVVIKRGPRAGSSMQVSSLAPLQLEYRGLQDFKARYLPNYRRLTTEILTDAAKGVGDD